MPCAPSRRRCFGAWVSRTSKPCYIRAWDAPSAHGEQLQTDGLLRQSFPHRAFREFGRGSYAQEVGFSPAGRAVASARWPALLR